MPVDDGEHQEPRPAGDRATGIMRPGSDPKKYMNLGKIDVATGEMRVLYSQPQASSGSALVTAGDLVFWGDQNRRLRAFDADDGKVLWEAVVGGMVDEQHHQLRGERQAIRDGVHRRRAVGHGRPARPDAEVDAAGGARPQLDLRVRVAITHVLAK